MKLLLVNIYPSVTVARYLMSSYILKAYISEYLKRDDLSINVLNFSSNTDSLRVTNGICKNNPDYIGFSCYAWNIEKIIRVLKEIKGELNAITILGGPEISIQRIQSFEDHSMADYYVIGEGEEKLYKLLTYLSSKTNEVEFPAGVAYWNSTSLHYEDEKGSIADLDKIPSIYLTGTLENHLYVRQQAFLETQRGCSYKCKYCVYHKNLSTYTYYSLDRVFNELEHLIIEKKVRAIRFLDAIFTSNKKRAKEIIKYLIELKEVRNIKIPWIYWEFYYHTVDDEILELISRLKSKTRINNHADIAPKNQSQIYSDMLRDYTAVNCVGIQSFCKESLKAVSRPAVIPEKFHKFMKAVNKYNIVLKVDMILGLPYETYESFFSGIEMFLPYFKDTDHVFNIHVLQILPGSDLESICNQYGINYSIESPHVVNSTNTLTEEEFFYASKLSAILFRIINSPLRISFFEAKERSGKSFFEFIENVFKEINRSVKFKETMFVKSVKLDDDYWNDDIFREISSEWLSDFINRY